MTVEKAERELGRRKVEGKKRKNWKQKRRKIGSQRRGS